MGVEEQDLVGESVRITDFELVNNDFWGSSFGRLEDVRVKNGEKEYLFINGYEAHNGQVWITRDQFSVNPFNR
jgi:hypothetical protein